MNNTTSLSFFSTPPFQRNHQLQQLISNIQTQSPSSPPLQSQTDPQQTIISLLTQINAANQLSQINHQTNNLIHIHNPLLSCPDVRQCESIKRIVKLGVFHSKYGANNAHIIAQFMNNCPEFSSLNADYQHSVLFHLDSKHKQQIANMSNEYEIVYDSIQNFHRNKNIPLQPLQQLTFYNDSMNAILNGLNQVNNNNSNLSNMPNMIELYSNLSNASNISIDTDDISSNSSKSSNTPIANAVNALNVQNISSTPTVHQLLYLERRPNPPSITNMPASTSVSNINVSNITVNNGNNLRIQNIPNPTTNYMTPQRNTSNKFQKIKLNPVIKPQFNNYSTYTPFPAQTNNYIRIVDRKRSQGSVKREPLAFKPEKKKIFPRTRISVAKKKDDGSRKFKCDKCHKQYKHLCNLKSHQKIHTDQALICPHCNKRFGRKANFKEHVRIHTGETPYQCNICKRKFKHHHSWKDHLRIHSGEKPYQCNICCKKFKVGHNLTVHLRIHSGEKPYNCHVCKKAFRQKSALNSHLKRMHN